MGCVMSCVLGRKDSRRTAKDSTDESLYSAPEVSTPLQCSSTSDETLESSNDTDGTLAGSTLNATTKSDSLEFISAVLKESVALAAVRVTRATINFGVTATNILKGAAENSHAALLEEPAVEVLTVDSPELNANGKTWCPLVPAAGDGRKAAEDLLQRLQKRQGTSSSTSIKNTLQSRLLSVLVVKCLLLSRALAVLIADSKIVNAVKQEVRQKQEYVSRRVADLQQEIEFFRKQIDLMHATILDRKEDILTISNTSSNGTFVWIIRDVNRRRQEAISGQQLSFYSPAFRVIPYGYKMALRMYLNGDSLAKGTYVSLFVVLLKSQTDPILKWPYHSKITLLVYDQNCEEHLLDAFKPDYTDSSFKQPLTNMNLASGSSLFIPIPFLDVSSEVLFQYVKDDTMYLKVIIDVSEQSLVSAPLPTIA